MLTIMDQSMAAQDVTKASPLIVHGISRPDIFQMTNAKSMSLRDAFGIGFVKTIASGSVMGICSECPHIIHGAQGISSVFDDPNRVMKIALGHNKILSELVQILDVLPLKLGTVCSSEWHVQQLLHKNEDHFQSALNHIAHAAEYGLKIIDMTKSEGAKIKVPLETLNKHPKDAGREYLKQQAQNVTARRQNTQNHKAFITDLMKAIHPYVKESKTLSTAKRKPTEKHTQIFNAALLIDHKDVAAFHNCVSFYDTFAKSKELSMTVSGPWPAYNFVSLQSEAAS